MVQTQRDMTAFVLAGGKSTRMGSDKAFLELNGKTLLQRALQTARAITPEAMIVGERARFSRFAPVVEDIFRNRGPLGAIHAALNVTATDLNLVLAVDLAFIKSKFLEFLFKRSQLAENAASLVVVPRNGHGFQPLCAFYRKQFGNVAEQALKRGENKIDSLFQEIQITTIGEPEIVRAGFSPDIFQNLNTPEDLAKAESLG